MTLSYTPAERANAATLRERILAVFTYPHGHPGVAGLPDGGGCPRCNAEKALDELVRRCERHS